MKLALKNVTKRFGEAAAVDRLSLEVREGEFLSLLGPSGCGKSTTLAMIAGLVLPDGGEIVIDGNVVNEIPTRQRGVGLVFQDYAVFTRLTVRDNLTFGLQVRGVRGAQLTSRVQELARRLDLEEILPKRGAALNMSEMQRVALARVLAIEPKLLLLDEPMSNLDAAVRASLRGELRDIQRRYGQTVFYVTHDQVEALSMSDRIAVMQDGKIRQLGTPEEIYRHPRDRFVAEFIGDPPINVVPCTVRPAGGGVAVELEGFGAVAAGRAHINPGRHLLAVRPHDVIVGRANKQGTLTVGVRFVENFGAEHVLHLDYLGELVRASVAPGFAVSGESVSIQFNMTHAHLIDADTGRVAQIEELVTSQCKDSPLVQ